jgi:plasmid replication initiation protein
VTGYRFGIHIGLRSRYALRLYSWAKKHVTTGTKRISPEELRSNAGNQQDYRFTNWLDFLDKKRERSFSLSPPLVPLRA